MTTIAPKRLSRVEEVCTHLRRRIRDGKLARGHWLPPERELARGLAVSRPVVREAIKRLEMQGLVVAHHGVGIQVSNRLHKPMADSVSLLVPDYAVRLKQLMEARRAIEPQVARLAANRATRAGVRKLRELGEEMAVVKDETRAIELDMGFHRLVAKLSENQVFMLMLDAVAELSRMTRQITITQYGVQHTFAYHEEIIVAIERGNPDQAEVAMRQHLEMAAQDLMDQLAARRTPRRKHAAQSLR